MESVKISIADNFSKAPGPRFIIQGPFSGELFRNTILEPTFKQHQDSDTLIIVDLDRTLGYSTSFLEEVFGGLARLYGTEEVAKKVSVTSEEEPYLIEDVTGYIRDANTPKHENR